MLMVRRNFIAIILIAATFVGSTAYADNFGARERSNDESRRWKEEKSVEGEVYYTAANMWYEKSKNFCSVNFHKGAIIPAGTKVEIIRRKGSKIKFYDKDNDMTYSYIHSKKHSRINLRKLFNRYFSQEDPMRPGGPFKKFAVMEKENIMDGTLARGMSKDAVLMAYGYPPTHRTPSLSGNVWTYWKARAGRLLVTFKDDKIFDMEGY